MSSSVSGSSNSDSIAEIWSLTTTFTDEAMKAASAKAIEMSLDQNRGVVPLQESFINLSSGRDILQDAIEKKKLVQLPITVQRELLANLSTISTSLVGLTGGADEVVNLTTAIESLNTSIWKYGLHNLSDQVLGYQKKLNQIKNLELQLHNAISELNTSKTVAQKALADIHTIEQQKNEAQTLLEQIKQSNLTSGSLADQIKDLGDKASTLFSTVQQQEKQGGELTSNIRTSSNELSSLDASIRKFYSEVEDHRKKMGQTGEEAAALIRNSEGAVKKLIEDTTVATGSALESFDKNQKAVTQQLNEKLTELSVETDQKLSSLATESTASLAKLSKETHDAVQVTLLKVEDESAKASESAEAKIVDLTQEIRGRADLTIGENQIKTASLIAELEKLKDQIKVQIEQATGFQLFHAFQARQNEIAKSKNIWVYAIAALVVISAVVTIWIAHEAQHYSVNNFAFWVKLSLTVPLGFALTFCTVQYSRERRLEEEYAFKSSISVSLNPYRELVLALVEKSGPDMSKYTDFVIDSVRNVFTPPTDVVFETPKKSTGLTEKTFKHAAEIIGTAVKASK